MRNCFNANTIIGKINKNKAAIYICFIIGLIIFILLSANRRFVEENVDMTNTLEITVNDGDVIRQRIVGNGQEMKELLVNLVNFDDKGGFDVFLVKGNDNSKNVKIDKLNSEITRINDDTVLMMEVNKKLYFGRDYNLLFEYHGITQQFDICISDKNGGLFVENNEYYCSIAYRSKIENNSSIILFIFKIFFLLLSSSLGWSIIFRSNINKSVGRVFLVFLLILYIGGVLNILEAAFYFIIFISILCSLLVAYYFVKSSEETINAYINNNVGYELYIWIVMMTIWIIAFWNRNIMAHDDLACWAYNAKNTYIFNELPFYGKCVIDNSGYPPLSYLFSYFVMRVNGNWNDGIIFISSKMLSSGLLLLCYDMNNTNKNRFASAVCYFLIYNAIPSVLPVSTSESPDYVLCIFMGIILIDLYKLIKDKNLENHPVMYIELILATFLMVQIKATGIVLLFIIIVSYGASNLLRFKQRKIVYPCNLYYFSCIIVGSLSYLSWMVYGNTRSSKVVNIDYVVSPERSIVREILNYILGNGKQYQYELIISNLKELLFTDFYSLGIVSLSYVGFSAILVALLIYWSSFREYQLYNLRMVIITIISVLTLSVVFMHAMYTFYFNEAEAVYLPQERRYLGTSIVAVILFAFFVIYEDEKNRDSLNLFYFWGIIGLLIVTGGVSEYRKDINNPAIETSIGKNRYWGYEMAKECRNIVGEDSKVYFISSTQINADDYLAFRYYLSPCILNNYISTGENNHSKGIYEIYPVKKIENSLEYAISTEELKMRMEDFSYVFLGEIDDRFVNSYNILFDVADQVCPNSLYKKNNSGKYSLIKSFNSGEEF